MQPRCRADDFSSRPLRDYSAGRFRLNRVGTRDTPHGVVLLALLVAFVERQAVGNILNRIAVQIHFEFVHPFRVVARHRDGAKNGVANVDGKHGALFSAKYV